MTFSLNGVKQLTKSILKSRSLLKIYGEDSLKFLQSLTTNNLEKETKNPLYTLFLSHKGRILSDGIIIPSNNERETYLVDIDSNIQSALMKHFRKYKLRSKVQIDDVTKKHEMWSLMPSIMEPQFNIETKTSEILYAFNDPRGDVFGKRIILSSDSKQNLMGEEINEAMDYDKRMLLGLMEGFNLKDRIPLESNIELLNGIHFAKGCYVGQELTARTFHKGNIRKRLIPFLYLSKEIYPSMNEIQFPFLQQLEQYIDILPQPMFSSILEMNNDEENKINKQIINTKGKKVGEIQSIGKDINVGISTIRLENVLSSNENEKLNESFSTVDDKYHIIPFKPIWWPNLDPKTGKVPRD